MLPRRSRLQSSAFAEINRRGNFLPARFFSLRVMKNNLGRNRFGVTVGGQISKKATERNKIRRRIYEIIRRAWGETPKGLDAVFSAKKSALGADFNDLKEDILQIIKILNSQ